MQIRALPFSCQVPHSPGRARRASPPTARTLVVPVRPAFAGTDLEGPNLVAPPSLNLGLRLDFWDVIPAVCGPALSGVAVFVRSPLPNIGVLPPAANVLRAILSSTTRATCRAGGRRFGDRGGRVLLRRYRTARKIILRAT